MYLPSVFVVRGHFSKARFIGVFKRFRIVVPHLIFAFSVTPFYTKTYGNLKLLHTTYSSTTILTFFPDLVYTNRLTENFHLSNQTSRLSCHNRLKYKDLRQKNLLDSAGIVVRLGPPVPW